MIDTLAISKELEEVGFIKKQADAIAQIAAKKQDNLATKDDIANLEDKIDTVEQVLQRQISPFALVEGKSSHYSIE